MKTGFEQLFDGILNGRTGNKPEDYYINFNSKGGKCYYSRITGGRVSKSRIPKEFHEKIQVKDPKANIASLLVQKNAYELEIEKSKAKLDQINEQISKLSSGVPMNEKVSQEYIDKEKEQKIQDEARRKEYEKEEDEKFRKVFSDFEERFRQNDQRQKEEEQKQKKDQEYKPKSTPKKNKDDDTLLDSLGIKTKKDWKNWILANHPDRNKDTNLDLCKRVLSLGKIKFGD